MEFPDNLFYTKDHEWISAESGEARVGISAYAIEQLGDIVHVDLPAVGDFFEAGDSFGTVESTKTVSDLYMPASGKVIAINKAILRHPEELQEDPYDKGWLIKVELAQPADGLMEAQAYEAYIKEE